MDELVGWLRAQLYEDERFARAATAELDGPTLGADWQYDGRYVETARERTMVAVGSQDVMELGVGGHIAEHDPARVLRETDAKRRVIEEYESIGDPPPGEFGPDLSRAELGRVLRLLALPYADRPGYREEWRP